MLTVLRTLFLVLPSYAYAYAYAYVHFSWCLAVSSR